MVAVKMEEISRIYTVPLSKAWVSPSHRRAVRAVHMLEEFAERHMKAREVKIDQEVNRLLWSRGAEGIPRRITVKMERDEDGLVKISLPEASDKEVEEEEPKEEAPKQESEAVKQ